MAVLELAVVDSTSQRCRYPPGQAPRVQPETFGSMQAEQALLKVLCSLEGQGVVMQRMPVSRVAHTGLYSIVHILVRGAVQAVSTSGGWVGMGAVSPVVGAGGGGCGAAAVVVVGGRP